MDPVKKSNTTLAAAYGVSEQIAQSGRGQDEKGNFVILLNRKTLPSIISRRRETQPKVKGFTEMVLSLWERYFSMLD